METARGTIIFAALTIIAAITTTLALARPQTDRPPQNVGYIYGTTTGTPLATDAFGVLSINQVPTSLSFEPGAFKALGAASSPLWVTESTEFTHIVGTTATAVRNNEGQLKTIIIGTPAAGTVSVFDLASASCTGTPSTNTVAIITVTTSTPPQAIQFNAHLHNGICVQASAAMDITVLRQ